MVKAGDFRQDLYYRINVIELDIPPLRERAGDIPALVEHILQNIGDPGMSLSKAALKKLQEYPYPGNIRELENILERALTMSESEQIDVDDLHLPELDHSPLGSTTLETLKEDLEKQTIIEALEATKWNKTAAAKKLGITFRALRYRLEKLGIK